MVFKWTDDCQVAFQRFKKVITSSSVLAMSTENGTFVMDTGTSNQWERRILREDVLYRE